MSKYAPLTLRALAVVTSATSAAAAYPVAANLFGALPGGVMVASSAAAIYAGWHIVATDDDTDKRLVSGVIASLFAAGMVAGIHSSGDLQTATAATSTAIEADTLYSNQESTRMATLATVAAELRSTSKREFPDQYNKLQAQVSQLSNPTARTATATQTATATPDPAYRWDVAGLLEVVSPALLLLAGMFTPRTRTGHATDTVETPRTRTGHATAKLDTLPDTQNLKASNDAVSTLDTLTDTLDTLTDTDENDDEKYTYAEPTDTALTGIRNRSVSTTDTGNVTRQAVQDYANCTKQDAMYAIGVAVQEGYLDKSGEGRNVRYTYTNKLRIIK